MCKGLCFINYMSIFCRMYGTTLCYAVIKVIYLTGSWMGWNGVSVPPWRMLALFHSIPSL